VIYLDTSALVKVVFEETESDGLARWLAERQEIRKLTSEVSTVELIRVCRRLDVDAVADARQLLAGLDLVPLGGEVLDQAARVDPVSLRTLDAIHLASALTLSDAVTAFVVYDTRLAGAADAAGFEVVTPK
jgi:predicted nucleic acid-binding protein